MNSKHAEKLLKMLRSLESIGFKNIGVWLKESVGRENLFIEMRIAMELNETLGVGEKE